MKLEELLKLKKQNDRYCNNNDLYCYQCPIEKICMRINYDSQWACLDGLDIFEFEDDMNKLKEFFNETK